MNQDGIIEAGKEIKADEMDKLLPKIKRLVEKGRTISQALESIGRKSCCTQVAPVQRRMLEQYGVGFRNTLMVHGIRRLTPNLKDHEKAVIITSLRDLADKLEGS